MKKDHTTGAIQSNSIKDTAANFATGTACVGDTNGKSATVVNNTSGKFGGKFTTGTISDCLHLKVNLKETFIYIC
jgi:hypothetical protein